MLSGHFLITFKHKNVDRLGKIEKVNGFKVKHVSFKESDNVTVAELDLIIAGYESQDEIAELKKALEKLAEELKIKVDTFEDTRLELIKTANELKQLKDSQNDSKDLLSELDKVRAESAQKDELLNELNDKVEQLAANKGAVHPHPVVTRNRKRFYLTVKSSKVRHDGENKDVTEDTLKQDTTLFDYLIEKKAGILVPLEEGGEHE